ncbi:1-acyl-sn-glycerol-3-phosphate acyltransferase PLS1-like [Malus sylvestris]|uniref:1-acyl-sn-glycerol-3-phosphate acyltransferase PLS1-like n=1 Tax=Malus sylvestris TaxID=3752 RepID=UPI0021ACC7F3|nr:1-acyl-sn-glycerol-3-phosphate acyltransferase PLS1-like [Malus sylvestris]
MEVRAVLFSIPFGLTFLLFGLAINLIQAVCFLTIRPLSKSAFRQINGAVASFLWLDLIWLMEWWGGLKVKLYTDLETYRLMGKEHALLMPNHICDADILMGLLLANRSGCLRSALMVVKKSSKYLPVFGWTSWFLEFVFLDRSWEKDESNLKASLQRLKDFTMPFWLTIFAEGTRMSPDKLSAAREFAASRKLPIPRNVMIPRTKGFVTAVKNLRSFVPAIYDVTLAVPEGHSTPSLYMLMERQHTVVKVHVKRYSMTELPESDEGIAQWCRDRFVAKDSLLDKFKAEGTFPGQEIHDTGRSIKALLAYTSSFCTLCLAIFELFQKFSLLYTWGGVGLLTASFLTIMLIIHIFIEYTKLPKQNGVKTTPSRKGQAKEE